MATKKEKVGLSTFDDARYDEETRHRRHLHGIHDDRTWAVDTLSQIKRDGITLIDSGRANDIDARYHMDIFALAQAQCDQLHRPYIKCREINSKPVITIPNTPWCKGLGVTLMILAKPPEEERNIIQSRTGPNRYEYITPEPGLYSKEPVLSWIKPRSMTFQFNGDEGRIRFHEWVEYCMTDHYAKTILGTY